MSRRHRDESTPLQDLFTRHATTESPVPRRRWLAAVGFVATAAITATVLTPLAAPVVAATHTAATFWQSLPDTLPAVSELPQRTVLLDRNGRKFAEFYSQNRVPVTRHDIPDTVINAVTATEDAKFFTHTGLDPAGLARAAMNNASGGDRQGGSTLTQQYVKNLLALTADSNQDAAAATEVSWQRKAREAKLALLVEQQLSKDDIITGYLNTAYFGAGAYGIHTAAHRYFSVDPADLTTAQAALLAGLLQAPDAYDPLKNPDLATQRRAHVLNRMAAEGHLTRRATRTLTRSPLGLAPSEFRQGCAASPFPFYCQWVQDTMTNSPLFGDTKQQRDDNLHRGGYVITTALDPAAQRAATRAARSQLDPRNRVASGVAVTRPGTGEIVAVATNRDYGTGLGATQIVYPTQPVAPIGSNFKPFVLATALEQGFDLATTITAPSPYWPATGDAPPGGFRNSDLSSYGPVTARTAAGKSINTWFIRLAEQVGIKNAADTATRYGATPIPTSGPDSIGPGDWSVALGSHDGSPVDLATAYSVFAANGRTCPPSPFLTITRPADSTTMTVPRNCQQVTTPAVADSMARTLTAAFSGGGTAHTLRLPDNREAFGKTGTTDNSAATWFTGGTPQYVASVWVGDPRGGFKYPLNGVWAAGRYYDHVYGASIAGPIWRATMTDLHHTLPRKRLPDIDPATAFGSLPITPDYRGLPTDTARTAAEAAGYTVTVTNPVTGDPRGPGIITDQHPTPGSTHPLTDTTITLTPTG